MRFKTRQDAWRLLAGTGRVRTGTGRVAHREGKFTALFLSFVKSSCSSLPGLGLAAGRASPFSSVCNRSMCPMMHAVRLLPDVEETSTPFQALQKWKVTIWETQVRMAVHDSCRSVQRAADVNYSHRCPMVESLPDIYSHGLGRQGENTPSFHYCWNAGCAVGSWCKTIKAAMRQVASWFRRASRAGAHSHPHQTIKTLLYHSFGYSTSTPI